MNQNQNILQIENLSKYFGGLAAVLDCSLKIKKGSITGIIGPNGSGKTTLFNLIAGNLKASDGKVFFYDDVLPEYDFYTFMLSIPKILKWEPKISFDNLVSDMVEHDLKNVDKF